MTDQEIITNERKATAEVYLRQAAEIAELKNKLRFVLANPVYISECAAAWSVRHFKLADNLRMKADEYQSILDVLEK